MKGQLAVRNFLVVLVTIIIFFIAGVPLMDDIIDDFVADRQANPTDTSAIEITIAELMPFFILLAIVLTTFYYAIPHREGVGGY